MDITGLIGSVTSGYIQAHWPMIAAGIAGFGALLGLLSR